MVENLGRIWRSRRKELERERGRILSHDIRDVHASKSIFVPAATFGQLTKHIFDHGGGSHPNSDGRCQHGIQHIFVFRQKRKAKCSSCLVSRHTFAFVLVTVVPSGSTLPPIERGRIHFLELDLINRDADFYENVPTDPPEYPIDRYELKLRKKSVTHHAGLLFVLRCSLGKPDHRRKSRHEAIC